MGFETVTGIEPSTAAISAAPAHRHSWIREGIFVESDYKPESFDLICCFMTMEHVREPADIANSVLRLLKPGGAFVTVTHDYRSFVNRLMGRRSPIVDIEHMQLFSARSIASLFTRCGYVNVQTHPFSNRYALRYWMRLTPLPAGVKNIAQRFIESTGIDRLKISMNVGNTVAFGYKPVDHFGALNTAFGLTVYSVCIWCGSPTWLALIGGNLAGLAFNFVTTGGLVFADLSPRRIPAFAAVYV
ncbi:conserved hypothetical protein, partial [Ricinus communis]